MSRKQFNFVCVNYNGFDFTKAMILSLLSQECIGDEFDLRVVVVDNSPSIDLDIKKYCLLYENVRYIRSDKNEGYFAALNLGLQSLSNEDNKAVIVCNNDLVFDRSFCKTLSRAAVAENVQVICPDVVTLDGVHQNPHHLAPLSRLKIFAFDCYFCHYYISRVLVRLKKLCSKMKPSRKLTNVKYPLNLEINQGVGACYILTAKFIELHKELFFPSFLYGEEATLSWQVRNSGGVLVYNSSLMVEHAESATLSKLPSRDTYEFARNSYWIIREYLSDKN